MRDVLETACLMVMLVVVLGAPWIFAGLLLRDVGVCWGLVRTFGWC